jgi:hypothetical protein
MIRLLALAAVCAAVVAAGTPAQAQDYPWCAQYAGFGSLNCGYSTYAQCMASLSGNGGFCNQNPQYSPVPVPHGGR